MPSELIELQPGALGDREVTVYVKGFLSRGEKADHFERWLACHKALVQSHAWGAKAFGFLAALDTVGVNLEDLDLIVHGTTTTTNALLERKISRCGLITTRAATEAELGTELSQQMLSRTRPLALLNLNSGFGRRCAAAARTARSVSRAASPF